MAGCCEHGNESSGSIKGEQFVDYFRDYHSLKRGFGPLKVKGKISLYIIKHHHKGVWRSSGTTPRILNLGTACD
jgi:hypothetical protein